MVEWLARSAHYVHTEIDHIANFECGHIGLSRVGTRGSILEAGSLQGGASTVSFFLGRIPKGIVRRGV